MDISSVKFAYLRDPKNPKRVLTLCMRTEGGFLIYSFAVCNPDVGDRFSRKIGRNIAFGRMMAGDYWEICRGSEGTNLMQVVMEITTSLVMDTTTRRICKHWLEEQEYILQISRALVTGTDFSLEKTLREDSYDHTGVLNGFDLWGGGACGGGSTDI